MRWNSYQTVHNGVLAGAAGGLAEIIWISIYAATTGSNAASIASGISTAAGVSALLPTSAAFLGIVIHMALAVALGIAFAFAWRAISAQLPDGASPYVLSVPALAVVWAVNFFILLPIISPAFVPLVPYSISLLSKLLFGLAAAEVLRRSSESKFWRQRIEEKSYVE